MKFRVFLRIAANLNWLSYEVEWPFIVSRNHKFWGNSIETYHFEDRKWLKMSISCLSLAIKAKLCIFHTANNEVIPSVSKKPNRVIHLKSVIFRCTIIFSARSHGMKLLLLIIKFAYKHGNSKFFCIEYPVHIFFETVCTLMQVYQKTLNILKPAHKEVINVCIA